MVAAIGCKARNTGRGGAVAAFAAAANQELQGRRVAELAGAQSFDFDIAGLHIGLRGDLLGLAPRARDVVVFGRLTVTGSAH